LVVLDDRYELSEELGRGSTGTVWEAWDRETSTVVAVKRFGPHVLHAPQARRRFLREVDAARALDSPHFVRVLAHATTADGGAYLVMERLVGTTSGHTRKLRQEDIERRENYAVAANVALAAGGVFSAIAIVAFLWH
jgi:eukaryotic-like serine/threonine-protein kinase